MTTPNTSIPTPNETGARLSSGEPLKLKFDFAREMPLDPKARYTRRYSICTLVTKPGEYEGMVDSFLRGGFVPDLCEYMFIDNSKGNKADAYKAYNAFLGGACGEYIILCHQDVVLLKDGIQKLNECIQEMDRIDPSWAVLGNAGGVKTNRLAIRITHPSGELNTHHFPVKVQSLDENFILVKNSANLCVSHDLYGFHMYGADICQMARFVGLTCWVVDFNLLHNGPGKVDGSFYDVMIRMEAKRRKFCAEGFVQTTCALLSFSDSWFKRGKALYSRIYGARKNCPEAIPPMRELLDRWSYAFFWLRNKICRPFENLSRSLRKRMWRRRIG
jgi:hypothetical protein